MSHEVIEAFMRYEWPGNVRELENAVEHAVVLCDGPMVHLKDLPQHLVRAASAPYAQVTAEAVGSQTPSGAQATTGAPASPGAAEPTGLPCSAAAPPEAAHAAQSPSVMPLAELAKQQILAALKKTGGNKKKAARLLGIHRMTLHKKLKQMINDQLPMTNK